MLTEQHSCSVPICRQDTLAAIGKELTHESHNLPVEIRPFVTANCPDFDQQKDRPR